VSAGATVLPSAVESEREVLGYLLGSPADAAEIVSRLRVDHFSAKALRSIFEAIAALLDRGEAVDVLLVVEELRRRGRIGDVRNGPLGVEQIRADSIGISANARTHVERVIEAAERRIVVLAARDVAEAASAGRDWRREAVRAARDLGARRIREILPVAEREEVPASWQKPIRVGAIASGDAPKERATMLQREDGVGLAYRGRVNEIHGEAEAGKGFVAGFLVAEVVAAGGRVLYLDFDADPTSVGLRLRSGGIRDAAKIDELVDVFPIDAPLPMSRRGDLEPAGRSVLDEFLGRGYDLVAIDDVNAAIAFHGFDPNDTAHVANFLRLFVAPFHAAGVTGILLDHVTKDRERRGRYQSGSVHKMNAVDGASFEAHVLSQPAPGRLGKIALRVSKDRHGAVRAASISNAGRDVAATVEIDGRSEIPVVRLRVPSEDETRSFRPTGYMERISRYLEIRTEPAATKQIEEEVPGKAEIKRTAIRVLREEGFVAVENGPHGANLHRSVRPFREAEEEAAE